MFAGSQPMKNYYKEKFLGQFYARSYSKPHRKILKNLLKFGEKNRVWRIMEKWKHEERTASQKDLYHNTFWHIIKKINEKKSLDQFSAHPHGNSSLLLGFVFVLHVLPWLSGAFVDMARGQNLLQGEVQVPRGHGDGQEKIREFSQQGWGWKTSVCEECTTCPQLLAKWNLFTFVLGLLQTLFYIALHRLDQNQSRKNSPWPILFSSLLWLCVNFKALQD